MGETATHAQPPSWRLLWLVALAGVVVRVLFLVLETPTQPVADERTWVDSARIVSDPRVSFSPLRNHLIFHPPLYTYFLAVPEAYLGLTTTKWIQAVLTVLLVPAVGRVAGFALGPRVGLLAAGLCAFSPELVWLSAHFWVENLFLALLWWAFERLLTADAERRLGAALFAGFLWGLAVLARETALYFAPLAALWLALPGRSERAWGRSALFLLGSLLTVAPWTYRNWIVFRAFVPVSTAAGQNLFQGNTRLPRDETYALVDKIPGRVEQYRYARAMGLAAIRERQPWWLLEKVVEQMPRFWEAESMALIHIKRGAYGQVSPGPARVSAIVLLLPYLVVLALFAPGAARAPLTRVSLLLLGFLVYYNLLHVVAHGFNRYRLPVMPIVFAFAAHGFAAWRLPLTARRRLVAVALALGLGLSVLPSLRAQLDHPAYRTAFSFRR